MNIIDLGNNNNITLLKLNYKNSLIYILCTKRTYNGKTIYLFENYDDLISNILNFNTISFNSKCNSKLLKSFSLFRDTIKSKNKYSRKDTYKKKKKHIKYMKTFIHNPNVKYLLNFFKKKSSASSIENKLKKNIKQKKKK